MPSPRLNIGEPVRAQEELSCRLGAHYRCFQAEVCFQHVIITKRLRRDRDSPVPFAIWQPFVVIIYGWQIYADARVDVPRKPFNQAQLQRQSMVSPRRLFALIYLPHVVTTRPPHSRKLAASPSTTSR
jgi:hypothetical protein